MERAALPRRLSWQLTTVVGLIEENPRTTSIVLEAPRWPGHRAGQHVDVRPTAEDGYQAQRSYSTASAPEDGRIRLTVERLIDGKVSPYLTGELRPGDELELRGPIGRYFVWEQSLGGPLLLVRDGSGVAPLRAMLRHQRITERDVSARLLYSARTRDDLIYPQELASFDTSITLTRERPEGWDGYTRWIDHALLEDVASPAQVRPLVYVCGPTAFVETAADLLVALGHEAGRIRIERFVSTGT